VTRAEFNNALEEALQKAARARAYTSGRYEIALIVTRDVYRFLSEHAGVTFDVRNTDHGIYRGYRIGIVNEQGYSDILKPAMLGMEYYNGMEVNDIIVVGDENRLFQLESREPICFRDMGLTVSFGNGARATANATVTNTVANAINAGTTARLNWNNIGRATVDWLGAVPAATVEPARQVRAQRPARPMASRAEEPLNPGDTKMLDEFLDSFAIKDTLQHA
jgi:hypothetical protein